MGTQAVQMKGVLPWLNRWARCAGTRDFCLALVAAVGPVQFFFPHSTVLGHLSLNVCLWSTH